MSKISAIHTIIIIIIYWWHVRFTVTLEQPLLEVPELLGSYVTLILKNTDP